MPDFVHLTPRTRRASTCKGSLQSASVAHEFLHAAVLTCTRLGRDYTSLLHAGSPAFGACVFTEFWGAKASRPIILSLDRSRSRQPTRTF
jgi:hypothetical protein